MKDLTLKNYAAKLSKDLMLLAKKNKVRECDEIKKGQFVAYVDEGSDSYDVELVFGTGGKVTGHTCDCANGSAFCRHKTALLIHLAVGGKTADPVKGKKKESQAETLLNTAGADQLREWVRGLVTKNKDIELSFVHHFSVKEQPTPVDVIKVTNDAIKAVAGNKKNIDPTQLKRLVDLWSEMHSPMITHYQANPTDEKSFLNFHTMLETCLDFDYKIPSGSTKILKFIETTLQNSQECIANLYNEEAWAASINLIIRNVPENTNRVRMHYLVHLKNIMELSSADRKLKMIDWLAKQFGKSTPDRMFNGTAYQKFIFELIVDQDLFSQYYGLFDPIRFDNEYNGQLIDLLIENDQLDIAKKYCNEQIKGNYKEEFNIPYYKSLKQIFTIQNDEENLSKISVVLFPYTFDFDDYLAISGTMDEEERKKWRTKMLARARNSSYCRTKQAMEFCFKLARHDNQPRKMIESIQSYTPYQLILIYFEPMAQGDKTRLLETLIRKSDDSWYGSSVTSEQDAACFPELFALAEKYYTAEYLKAVIKSAEKDKWSYYNRLNRFMTYMKERLD